MDKQTFCEQIEWPQVFIDGVVNYTNDVEGQLQAVGDAFTAWGHSAMGCQMPEYFGVGMSNISKFLGVMATPENLTELMNQLLTTQVL